MRIINSTDKNGELVDNRGVSNFRTAMETKLADQRNRGKEGWQNPADCSIEYLETLLAEEFSKSNDRDYVDIANYSMMLWNRKHTVDNKDLP